MLNGTQRPRRDGERRAARRQSTDELPGRIESVEFFYTVNGVRKSHKLDPHFPTFIATKPIFGGRNKGGHHSLEPKSLAAVFTPSAAPLLADVKVPLRNWTIPPYRTLAAGGGLSALVDISNGIGFAAPRPFSLRRRSPVGTTLAPVRIRTPPTLARRP